MNLKTKFKPQSELYFDFRIFLNKKKHSLIHPREVMSDFLTKSHKLEKSSKSKKLRNNFTLIFMTYGVIKKLSEKIVESAVLS